MPQIDELYTVEVAKLMYQHNQEKYLTISVICSLKQMRFLNDLAWLSASDNFDISRIRSNRVQRSFRYQEVEVWNSIPNELESLSFRLFKSRYKNHLI